MAQSGVLPVLFVVDHDPNVLAVLLSDLSRRFGNDFTVRGSSLPDAALAALQELAAANQRVALLLVDDAASEILLRARRLSHRAAVGGRRDALRGDERVPRFLDEGTEPEL